MNDILRSIRTPVQIFFVRHAQSEHNARKLVAGRIETPLTEKGIAQAEKTAAYLAEHAHPDIILHSPIGRAEHTARIIFDACNASASASGGQRVVFEREDNLMELDAGVFENQNLADIEARQPAAYARFIEESWEAVENAERISSLIARARALWARLALEASRGAKSIVCVSHGGFMQWIFKTSFGFEGEHAARWSPIVRISNCGIFLLSVDVPPAGQEQAQNGHASWDAMNYTAH